MFSRDVNNVLQILFYVETDTDTDTEYLFNVIYVKLREVFTILKMIITTEANKLSKDQFDAVRVQI